MNSSAPPPAPCPCDARSSHLAVVFSRTHEALDVLTDLGDLRRSLQAQIAVRFESGRAVYITRPDRRTAHPTIECLREVIPVGGSAIIIEPDHWRHMGDLDRHTYELHEVDAVS